MGAYVYVRSSTPKHFTRMIVLKLTTQLGDTDIKYILSMIAEIFLKVY